MLPREHLVAPDGLIFQKESQADDLSNPDLTSTYLIEFLDYLVFEKGWNIEVTAVRSDHHDDGPNGHAGGLAIDCWPLDTHVAGDYIDAVDPRFAAFLADALAGPNLWQMGLGGTAWTTANAAVIAPLGGNGFQDGDADHVHLGIHAP